MYCGKHPADGVPARLGTVDVWPECRDPSITHYFEPEDYSAHGLEPAQGECSTLG